MTTLTLTQLETFERRIRSAGGGAVDALLPGLEEAEIRQAFSAFPDLHIPGELITWWGWHGGIDLTYDPAGRFGGAVGFASPFDAASSYGRLAWPAGHEHLLEWVHAQDPWKYVECAPSSPDVGRVLIMDKGESDARPFLPSLGALVEVWTDLIDRGIWTYPDGRASIAQHLVDDQDALTWRAV